MRKIRILSALLTVLMVFGIFGTFATPTVEAAEPVVRAELSAADQKRVDGMELYLTSPNGQFELYMDPESADFAYVCVPTGEVMFSTPGNLTGKASATATYRSTVLINYKDIWGNNDVLNSYEDAYELGQINIKRVKTGVRVEYTMGEEPTVYYIPVVIDKDRFEQLVLDKITNATDKRRVSIRYNLYDVTGLDPESDKYKGYVSKCPQCVNGPVYMLSTAVDATSDVAKQISDLLAKYTDYSYEDYQYDATKHNVTGTIGNTPVFRFALEYKLDNTGLEVNLSGGSISFDENLYTLKSIDILPYFGAAARNQTGYTFVPDGSGAITYFEDAVYQNKPLSINGSLYGIDYATHILKGSTREIFRLPVFGLVKDTVETDDEGNSVTSRGGFVAIITAGEAVGTISATCEGTATGRAHSVWASVCPMTFDEYNLNWDADFPITIQSDRRFTGDFTVRYSMLHDEAKAAAANIADPYRASYVGMADAYRDYLIDTGVLSDVTTATSVPLFIEAFGSVKYDDKILTFPIEIDLPLTTFEDVQTMWTRLHDGSGIENINFILTGFANQGIMRQAYPSSLKWISALGGKSGIRDLISFADEHSFNLYPNFNYAYSQNRNSKGLNYKYHAGRMIDNRYITKREYDPATQTFVSNNSTGVSISASVYDELYTKFLKQYSKYDFSTIGVMTLGTALNSDFDDEEPYNREDSKMFTVNVLEKMASEYEVLVSGGNAYTLPYASVVVELPTDSSLLLAGSESVPFAGMVLHGYKTTTGEVLNSAGDTDYAVMKAIESGVGAYFQLSYQNVHHLKDYVFLSQYYAVDFQNWYDEMVEIYKELNNNIGTLQSTVITDHEFLSGYRIVTEEEAEAGIDYVTEVDNRIARVEYGGNTSFILNYNYNFGVTVTYEDMEIDIPALCYVKIVEGADGHSISNFGGDELITVDYNGTTYTIGAGETLKIN
ncbi:MAG: hypothetical protein J6D21_02740 [Clostridia bacterium]|nr:hypothetical protein [Clostridia bacterium]